MRGIRPGQIKGDASLLTLRPKLLVATPSLTSRPQSVVIDHLPHARSLPRPISSSSIVKKDQLHNARLHPRFCLRHRGARPIPVGRLSLFSSYPAPVVLTSTQSPSSSIDPAPQTSFLPQTNSDGVVTGQPAVETSIPSQPNADSSIPALDTSVGIPASIPAVASGINTILVPGENRNQTRTLIVSANNSTTIVLGAPATATNGDTQTTGSAGASDSGRPTGTGPTSSGASGAEGQPSSTHSQGTAATMRAVAGSFVGAGLLAAFL